MKAELKLSPGRMRLLAAVIGNLTDRDVDKAFARGKIPPALKIEFLRVVHVLQNTVQKLPEKKERKSDG